MSYHLTITDDADSMTFELLEVPISDSDTEGIADNTTLDGNVYTDFWYLKKTYSQSFKLMKEDDYLKLRGFYTRQFENAKYPLLTMTELGVSAMPVRLKLSDGGIINNCGDRQNVKISMRETAQL